MLGLSFHFVRNSNKYIYFFKVVACAFCPILRQELYSKHNLKAFYYGPMQSQGIAPL